MRCNSRVVILLNHSHPLSTALNISTFSIIFNDLQITPAPTQYSHKKINELLKSTVDYLLDGRPRRPSIPLPIRNRIDVDPNLITFYDSKSHNEVYEELGWMEKRGEVGE
jgi:hypothetical protein